MYGTFYTERAVQCIDHTNTWHVRNNYRPCRRTNISKRRTSTLSQGTRNTSKRIPEVISSAEVQETLVLLLI